MDAAERKAALKEIKGELWSGWKILFVIQLVVGGHAILQFAAENTHWLDMNVWLYAVILLSCAAIITTILLIICVIVFIIAGSCVVGFMLWKEGREEKNDKPRL